MQEFIITGNDAGQRLDRFLGKAAPLLPASLMQKGIRTKNIKVNGKRAERGQRLCDGDVVRLYLDDRYFEKPAPDSGWKKVTAPKLHVVYEDSQILLVDKRPGIAVHPHDGAEYGRSSTRSRPISTPGANGTRSRSTPLPRPCATALTATPAASSSPRRRPWPCGS